MKKYSKIIGYATMGIMLLATSFLWYRSHQAIEKDISLEDSISDALSKAMALDGRINQIKEDIAALQVKTGLSWDRDTWEEQYKGTEQYLKDCFTWQSRHPRSIEKIPSNMGGGAVDYYCLDGRYGSTSDGCSFGMMKKTPNGTIEEVSCRAQKNPNDFIP